MPSSQHSPGEPRGYPFEPLPHLNLTPNYLDGASLFFQVDNSASSSSRLRGADTSRQFIAASLYGQNARPSSSSSSMQPINGGTSSVGPYEDREPKIMPSRKMYMAGVPRNTEHHRPKDRESVFDRLYGLRKKHSAADPLQSSGAVDRPFSTRSRSSLFSRNTEKRKSHCASVEFERRTPRRSLFNREEREPSPSIGTQTLWISDPDAAYQTSNLSVNVSPTTIAHDTVLDMSPTQGERMESNSLVATTSDARPYQHTPTSFQGDSDKLQGSIQSPTKCATAENAYKCEDTAGSTFPTGAHDSVSTAVSAINSTPTPSASNEPQSTLKTYAFPIDMSPVESSLKRKEKDDVEQTLPAIQGISEQKPHQLPCILAERRVMRVFMRRKNANGMVVEEEVWRTKSATSYEVSCSADIAVVDCQHEARDSVPFQNTPLEWNVSRSTYTSKTSSRAEQEEEETEAPPSKQPLAALGLPPLPHEIIIPREWRERDAAAAAAAAATAVAVTRRSPELLHDRKDSETYLSSAPLSDRSAPDTPNEKPAPISAPPNSTASVLRSSEVRQFEPSARSRFDELVADMRRTTANMISTVSTPSEHSFREGSSASRTDTILTSATAASRRDVVVNRLTSSSEYAEFDRCVSLPTLQSRVSPLTVDEQRPRSSRDIPEDEQISRINASRTSSSHTTVSHLSRSSVSAFRVGTIETEPVRDAFDLGPRSSTNTTSRWGTDSSQDAKQQSESTRIDSPPPRRTTLAATQEDDDRSPAYSRAINTGIALPAGGPRGIPSGSAAPLRIPVYMIVSQPRENEFQGKEHTSTQPPSPSGTSGVSKPMPLSNATQRTSSTKGNWLVHYKAVRRRATMGLLRVAMDKWIAFVTLKTGPSDAHLHRAKDDSSAVEDASSRNECPFVASVLPGSGSAPRAPSDGIFAKLQRIRIDAERLLLSRKFLRWRVVAFTRKNRREVATNAKARSPKEMPYAYERLRRSASRSTSTTTAQSATSSPITSRTGSAAVGVVAGNASQTLTKPLGTTSNGAPSENQFWRMDSQTFAVDSSAAMGNVQFGSGVPCVGPVWF